jgi:hypothetical protein
VHIGGPEVVADAVIAGEDKDVVTPVAPVPHDVCAGELVAAVVMRRVVVGDDEDACQRISVPAVNGRVRRADA